MYDKIMRDFYENINSENEKSKKYRQKSVYEKIPEFKDLEIEINRKSLEIAMLPLKHPLNMDKVLKKLKSDLVSLNEKKKNLLSQNGVPPDFLDYKYTCEKCKDTGILDTKKRCVCYNQQLTKLYYKNSDLIETLGKYNFKTFNIDLFSDKKENNLPVSQKEAMKKNHKISKDFIKNFDKKTDNLLFYGSVGTGKTFLVNCIAKELIDKAYLVVYKTADDFISSFRDNNYDIDNSHENLLIDADLLIIDDLGSEQITEFSQAKLFNIINKRILRNKKMLISTNLTPLELFKKYDDRIASRLTGDFKSLLFIKGDLRVYLNLKLNR